VDFRWSSVRTLVRGPRPNWLGAATLLGHLGLADTAAGWRRYLALLAEIALDRARLAADDEAFTRGWAIGSPDWKSKVGDGVSLRQQLARLWQAAGFCAQPAAAVAVAEVWPHPRALQLLHRRPTGRPIQAMAMAAQSGLDTMNSAETNPNERGLGKPCAGKPRARFDEGESCATSNRFAALSTLLIGPAR